MARISESIVVQNIEKNQFVAAFPGELVIGFVKKVPFENDFVFETSASFSRLNLQFLDNCLQNIGKILSGKKKIADSEEYDCIGSTLYRNETCLLVKKKNGSSCTFDLALPEIFKNFCDALFTVIFSILLPTNDQYHACYATNLFFRESFKGLSLPDSALESAKKKLDFPAPTFHYLRRNFPFLQFAHTVSTLANAK